MRIRGNLQKMKATLGSPVQYYLPIGEATLDLNAKIGQTIRLEYQGKIVCQGCGKATPKSYSQGYCFICTKRLARCDMCILKPEQCHYHKGTCREPQWGEEHCMIPHIVYLANTSGLKVGITRGTQVPTRWIDQGASQALPIIQTASRRVSGLIEVVLAQHIADKTNWRALLKGEALAVDLPAERDRLLKQCAPEIQAIAKKMGEEAFSLLDEAPITLEYPVETYPDKIKSIGFDKVPIIEKTLIGIKGQYLLFENNEVMNIRKHTGYQICAE